MVWSIVSFDLLIIALYIELNSEVVLIHFSFLLHFAQVCSGSWDCQINLWQTNELDKGGDLVSIKKRKKGNGDEETQLQVPCLLRMSNLEEKNITKRRNF